MTQPRKEFLLREVDPAFVAALKVQILEQPNPFPKPLIAIVKGVVSKKDFNDSQLDALELEVIGGNHRREALTQLLREGKLNKTYTMVQLYTGM